MSIPKISLMKQLQKFVSLLTVTTLLLTLVPTQILAKDGPPPAPVEKVLSAVPIGQNRLYVTLNHIADLNEITASKHFSIPGLTAQAVMYGSGPEQTPVPALMVVFDADPQLSDSLTVSNLPLLTSKNSLSAGPVSMTNPALVNMGIKFDQDASGIDKDNDSKYNFVFDNTLAADQSGSAEFVAFYYGDGNYGAVDAALFIESLSVNNNVLSVTASPMLGGWPEELMICHSGILDQGGLIVPPGCDGTIGGEGSLEVQLGAFTDSSLAIMLQGIYLDPGETIRMWMFNSSQGDSQIVSKDGKIGVDTLNMNFDGPDGSLDVSYNSDDDVIEIYNNSQATFNGGVFMIDFAAGLMGISSGDDFTLSLKTFLNGNPTGEDYSKGETFPYDVMQEGGGREVSEGLSEVGVEVLSDSYLAMTISLASDLDPLHAIDFMVQNTSNNEYYDLAGLKLIDPYGYYPNANVWTFGAEHNNKARFAPGKAIQSGSQTTLLFEFNPTTSAFGLGDSVVLTAWVDSQGNGDQPGSSQDSSSFRYPYYGNPSDLDNTMQLDSFSNTGFTVTYDFTQNKNINEVTPGQKFSFNLSDVYGTVSLDTTGVQITDTIFIDADEGAAVSFNPATGEFTNASNLSGIRTVQITVETPNGWTNLQDGMLLSAGGGVSGGDSYGTGHFVYSSKVIDKPKPGGSGIEGITVNSITPNTFDASILLGESGLNSDEYIRITIMDPENGDQSVVPNDGQIASSFFSHSEGNSGSLIYHAGTQSFIFSDQSDIAEGMDLQFTVGDQFTKTSGTVGVAVIKMSTGVDGVPLTQDDKLVGLSQLPTSVIISGDGGKEGGKEDPPAPDITGLYEILTSDKGDVSASGLSENQGRVSFMMNPLESLPAGYKFRFHVMQPDMSGPYDVSKVTLNSSNVTCGGLPKVNVLGDSSGWEYLCDNTAIDQMNYSDGVSFDFNIDFVSGPSSSDEARLVVMVVDDKNAQVGTMLATPSFGVDPADSLDFGGAPEPVSGVCDLDDPNSPPMLLFTSPTHNVNINSSIRLYFNECLNINLSDIKLISGEEELDITASQKVINDEKQGQFVDLTITRDGDPLPKNSLVTLFINVDNVTDNDDNHPPSNAEVLIGDEQASIFALPIYTGSEGERGFEFKPYLINTAPRGEDPLWANNKIVLEFSEELDESSLEENVKVYNAESGEELAIAEVDLAGFNSKTVLITGTENWTPNAELEVKIFGGLKALSGASLGIQQEEVYSLRFFTNNGVDDGNPPQLLGNLTGGYSDSSVFAISTPSLGFFFDEPLNPLSLPGSISCDQGVNCEYVYDWFDGSLRVVFENIDSTFVGTEVTVTFEGLEDLSGNEIASFSRTTTLSDPDYIEPVVTHAFARPDGVTIGFNMLMQHNSLSAKNGIFNIDNYVFTDNDKGDLIDVSSAFIHYNRAYGSVDIRGIDLHPYQDIKVVLSEQLKDKYNGNEVSSESRTLIMPVQTDGFFGAYDFGDDKAEEIWKYPVKVAPINRFAGAENVILNTVVTLQKGQTIKDGDILEWIMPGGFSFGSIYQDTNSPFYENFATHGSKSATFSQEDPTYLSHIMTSDDGISSNGTNKFAVRIDTGGDVFDKGDRLVIDTRGFNLPDFARKNVSFQLVLKDGSTLATKATFQPESFDIIDTSATGHSATVTVSGDASLGGKKTKLYVRTLHGEVEYHGIFDESGNAVFNLTGLPTGQFEVFTNDVGLFKAPQSIRAYVSENTVTSRTIQLVKWESNNDNLTTVDVEVSGLDDKMSGDFEIYANANGRRYVEEVSLPGDIVSGAVNVQLYLPQGDWKIGMEPAKNNRFSDTDASKTYENKGVIASGPKINVQVKPNGECRESSGTANDCAVSMSVETDLRSVDFTASGFYGDIVADARICIGDPVNHVGFCTATDSSGKARLEVPVGFYVAELNKSGQKRASASVMVLSDGSIKVNGQNKELVEFVIDNENTYAVSVKVTNKNNEPISGAVVTAKGSASTLDVHTDSNGRATMFLKNGTYVVEAKSSSWGYIGQKNVTVNKAPRSNIVIQPTNTYYEVSGRVEYDNGEGTESMENVYVHAWNSNFSFGASTDELGEYVLRLPSGNYEMVLHTSTGPLARRNITVSGSNVTENVTVTGEKYEVEFVVGGVGSNTVKRGFVELSNRNGRFANDFRSSNSASVEVFGSGEYRLNYGLEGRAIESISVTSGDATMNFNTGKLNVQGDAVIALNVATGYDLNFDISGVGDLAYAEVFNNTTGVFTGTELSNGSGTISGLPVGTYRVRVDSPGLYPLEGEVTIQSADKTYEATMEAPSIIITGTVRVDDEIPTEDAFVWAQSSEGDKIRTIVQDGYYTLAAKANRTYKVQAAVFGYEPTSSTVEVGETSVKGNNFNFDSGDLGTYESKVEPLSADTGGTVVLDGVGSVNVGSGAVSDDLSVTLREVPPIGDADDLKVYKTIEVEATTSEGEVVQAWDNTVAYTIELTESDLEEFDDLADLLSTEVRYYNETLNTWIAEPTSVTIYDDSGDPIEDFDGVTLNDVSSADLDILSDHSTIFGATGGSGDEGGGDEGGGDEGGGNGSSTNPGSDSLKLYRLLLEKSESTPVEEESDESTPEEAESINLRTLAPSKAFNLASVDLGNIRADRVPKNLPFVSDATSGYLGFSDTKGHWVARHAATLKLAGIVSGYSDGTFKPSQTVTRAEFLKMVMVSNGLDNQYKSFTSSGFTDVPDTHWAAKYFATAKEYGIVTGFGDGTARPNAAITRAEAVKIAMLASGKNISTASKSNSRFADVSSNDWFIQLVNAAYSQGVVNGIDGKFEPGSYITRAESAAMLVRSLNPSAVAFL